VRRGRPRRGDRRIADARMNTAPQPGALDGVVGRRILVTGGDGLIRRAAVRLLAELGALVPVFDLGGPGAAARAVRPGAVGLLTVETGERGGGTRSVASARPGDHRPALPPGPRHHPGRRNRLRRPPPTDTPRGSSPPGVRRLELPGCTRRRGSDRGRVDPRNP